MKYRFLINEARKVALKSPCPKAQFGTLVVVDYKVVAEGYNVPPAWPYDDCAEHCLRTDVASGTQLELCYALHSEQWAILEALQKGYDLRDAWLVVAGYGSDGEKWVKKKPIFYCSFCSRLILACGISGVLIDTVEGPYLLSSEEVWETSYKVARREILASGEEVKDEAD